LKRYLVGISGASGAVYARVLLEAMVKRGVEVHVLPSANGLKVFDYEIGMGLDEAIDEILNRAEEENDKPGTVGRFIVHEPDDFFAAPASGSFHCEGMAIVPCSMGTLGALASGAVSNLLGRAADVTLKERRPLVLVPRESPMNLIHLRNLTTLAEAGAVIVPPTPGFYHHPTTVEELVLQTVGRVMEQLGVGRELIHSWGEEL